MLPIPDFQKAFGSERKVTDKSHIGPDLREGFASRLSSFFSTFISSAVTRPVSRGLTSTSNNQDGCAIDCRVQRDHLPHLWRLPVGSEILDQFS